MNYNQKLLNAYGHHILSNIGDLKILFLYILDDNRFLYNVIENKKEYWYMVNGCNFKKLKINYIKNTDYKSIIFKLQIDNSGVFELEQYEKSIIIHDKDYDSVIDKHLFDMFYDIYRMNNSS